ncbi:2-hydroxyacid dehydrogenase [Arthrobacter sp. ISL-28]|uniref:2-hydroxyacid dehydrogenase n=1 Tax=Arthrobacter sp. ISL-28 TaxID=2819108 RepID=UPI001BE7F905|nr:2-hydroxyacid dehydrogenase [Arthrobacter sp. ISL-28]MBT2523593.1 2-hydroxyacid dehydrogenase [Arthrobacter sp. ISL-28]
MNNNVAVLQVGPLMQTVQDTVAEVYGGVRLPDSAAGQAKFLARHGHTFDVAVTSGRFGVKTELMRALPNLRAVVNFGVGYDTTDTRQAAERGIAVSNTPDVLNDCVADTAIALYVDVLRRTSAADRYVRRGDWVRKGNFPLATKASGKRVGILGLGRIGKVIARRLEGFDCTISYHNRNKAAGVTYDYASSPLELARKSDVLIVAAAGGPESVHVVDREVIEALGPGGYLVNIARGSVVDEQALVAALLAGHLGGAGLDVFADEPKVPQDLLSLDNVVLLPHLGSGTSETRAAMAELTLANLAQFAADRTLVTPVP